MHGSSVGQISKTKLHPKLWREDDENSKPSYAIHRPSVVHQHYYTSIKMASPQNPMQDYLNRIRQIQKSAGGRGGFGGGMPGGGPRIAALVAGGLVLTGGAWVVQNGLFNVDGGHRAIKYRRTTGVSKEIFGEGAFTTV